MKTRAIILVLIFFCLLSCGKKGPLKPPVVELPGIRNASFDIVGDRILIKAVVDDEVDFFKIERYEIDEKRELMSGKVIYEGIEKNIYFIDKNLDMEKKYQYKIIPVLKNKKTGKVYISNPVTFEVIKPPHNLRADILETIGSVTLYYEGQHCDSFNIYRYKEGEKKPQNPIANTKDTFYNDDKPVFGDVIIYEVSCVKKGTESKENPLVKVNLK